MKEIQFYENRARTLDFKSLVSEIDGKANNTLATTSANGLMTKEDKAKLNGIAANANNYSHPSTHPATMIVEDSTHRFVTDAEKNKWNNIQSGSQITYGTSATSLTSGGTGTAGTSTAVSRADHTHTLPAYPTALKNPNSLTVQFNGSTNQTYDGSSAKTVNITAGAIGAATSSHRHDNDYLKLSGGQVRGTITTESIDTETAYTGMLVSSGDISTSATIRSTRLSTGNTQMITADTDTVWLANPNSKAVLEASENPKVKVGSNQYTIYHTGNKPSASDIGAAASSHTHNYAGSSSAGGAANSATKLATARTINGVSFDGTANITVKDDTKLPLTGGTLSNGLCVNKNSKELWFDIGTNDAYLWSSASNKALQLRFNGNLDYDDQPVIYGGRGNNYDTAVGTLYFNNSGVNRKGRISCYTSENGSGSDYVQLAIRDSSSTKNYITIYDDIVRVGSNCISLGGKKLTIATSAPSSPSTGDVWIDI